MFDIDKQLVKIQEMDCLNDGDPMEENNMNDYWMG